MADRRYWDSCAFLGWLSAEVGKVEKCEGVLDLAEQGEIEIVTSALTLTEVIKRKGERPIHKASEIKIKEFFENPWIIVRQVDRFIAEDARELIWNHNLTSTDAIHLATALSLSLSHLDTFDDGLIKLSGRLGNPKLTIGHPHVPHTPDMFPGTKPPVAPRKKRKKKSHGGT
jgi:predicted nucleic acid-binding protein